MRILDKYILKEFLGPFLFGVAAFTAIFLGADTLLKIADYNLPSHLLDILNE